MLKALSAGLELLRPHTPILLPIPPFSLLFTHWCFSPALLLHSPVLFFFLPFQDNKILRW